MNCKHIIKELISTTARFTALSPHLGHDNLNVAGSTIYTVEFVNKSGCISIDFNVLICITI
ncbi:hypothetical protein [Solibacillus isronensis]|uniref:hypothetical protein n=1 Tax=Solibacillus isronensis TaxID=412383 RepID=UPI00399F862A